MTTGSTMRASAEVLRAAGAVRVYGVVVTRAVHLTDGA
jgi:predicted amidophosphoribosyltransferase